ncbi:MAG: pyridoxal-phosphate dependent enzyme [Anaerolineales bacterium]|nr:pyridoxal-phosphate dependent enzyme [Anaerolineales bacterium]
MSELSLPRVRFAHLPTPVEPLSRLSAEFKGSRIWIKRDDQTGLAFGGNKTRKLEFLIAEAQAHGARTLITRGAAQSNHCRQTAAAAARFGFDCVLVLNGSPSELKIGNLLLDHLFNAEIVWNEGNDPEVVLQETFEQAWSSGRRPYLVPYGGSNPVGAAAYAFAIQELLSQNIPVDHIILASSSGGTQAGLLVGAQMFDYQGSILGISVDPPAQELKIKIADLATATAELLNLPFEFSEHDVDVRDEYLGEGYGVVSDLERDAVKTLARTEGVLLDPVYTGRAAGGMLDLLRSGRVKLDGDVLFWHTGGTPAIFAHEEELA